jgi:hypothetical protein
MSLAAGSFVVLLAATRRKGNENTRARERIMVRPKLFPPSIATLQLLETWQAVGARAAGGADAAGPPQDPQIISGTA